MIATYRLQLTPDFDFDAAAAVVPYLAELGISDIYASPYLQATPGSTHGYDVVDHARVNEELGGEKGRDWFCRRLAEHDMGHLLDIVPNHMAIGGPENAWWWDVLENGPSSRFASFFDVDWEYPPGESRNRILLPILGDHYGRLIESGELRLERVEGSFFFRYYEHVLPVSPRSLSGLLTRAARSVGSEELGFLASALDYLPLSSATDRSSVDRRHRDKEIIRSYLAQLLDARPNVRRAVDAEVERVNNEPDLMDALHESQNYRLALWRLARSDLGYRRFFDINTLIGLRMEEEEVFYETHRRILEWFRDGSLRGVRVDHPDGLRDPLQYFRRLRNASPEGWIFGEKILEEGESLPADWPIEGTTGYEFLNVVNRLMIPPESEERFTEFYRYFTGEQRSYPEILHACKHTVLQDLFASDVYRLVDLFLQVCGRHRRYRDFNRDDVTRAISEVLATFPVYRSYVVADGERSGVPTVTERDREVVQEAVDSARECLPEVDGELFDFLQAVLTLESTGAAESEFVMRFQQLSGPVQAKGAEDTAFYVYNRLSALNEVGGNPAHFGSDTEAFHDFMRERAAQWPHAMSAGSTHDAKRSEDTRARIAVVTEVPDRWEEFVHAASVHNEQYRSENTPERNLEYLIYQNLVGAWPISFDRIWTFTEKAMREAKIHTTWTAQDPDYEGRVRAFVEGIMADEEFRTMLTSFVDEIALPGWKNAFAATLIRLTAPGIPDTYQGCELWSHTLVDPDNRAPVDFEERRALLQRLDELQPEAVFEDWESGLPKLQVIREALRLRQERPAAFGPDGGYEALPVTPAETSADLSLGAAETVQSAADPGAQSATAAGAAPEAAGAESGAAEDPGAEAGAAAGGSASEAPGTAESGSSAGAAAHADGAGRVADGDSAPDAASAGVPRRSNPYLAYRRGEDVVVLVRRFNVGPAPRASLALGAGSWEDRLTGRTHRGGTHDVAALLGDVPGALLVRASE